MFFYPMVKVYAFTFSNYLGSVGGLLGLFAGVSVISLIEIVFHLVYKPTICYFNRNITVNPKPKEFLRSPEKNQTIFFEFSKKTSIHGLNMVVDKRKNRFQNAFWIIVVTFSLTVCIVMTSIAYRHAEFNPLVISIDDKVWSIYDVSKFLLFEQLCVMHV